MTLETRAVARLLATRDAGDVADRREVTVRLFAYDTPADIPGAGFAEAFGPGCLRDTRAENVRLYGPGHREPIGRGLELRDGPDGPTMTFRISETVAGDDAYTLARDGVLDACSVGFEPERAAMRWNRDRSAVTHGRIRLRHVALTDLPIHETAAVLAVRDQGGAMPPTPTEPTPTPTEPQPAPEPAPDPTPAPEPPAPESTDPWRTQVEALAVRDRAAFDALVERVRRVEARDAFAAAPAAGGVQTREAVVRWARGRLFDLAGMERPLELRALADSTTANNSGVVPPAYVPEMVGLINTARSFLASTRQLPTPDAGMKLVMPKIGTRPTIAKQAAEKTAINSTAATTTTVEFDAETYAGGADISLQLLVRSSPSFLDLWWELIAEAYGNVTDLAAIAALMAETGVVEGGAADPGDPSTWRGEAWANTYSATRGLHGPDTIWLTPAAAGAFLDAKDDSGRPLYPFLNPQNAQGAGQVGGAGAPFPNTIDGLRPVIVPPTAFGAQPAGVDMLVGWSRGFAWAEDGTYRLRVTNVELLGEDVALAGILWFAPLYPEAFTSYTVGPIV